MACQYFPYITNFYEIKLLILVKTKLSKMCSYTYMLMYNINGCIFLSFSLAVLYACVLLPNLMSISVMEEI